MLVKFRADHMHNGAWYEAGKVYEVDKEDVKSIDPKDFKEVDEDDALPEGQAKVLKSDKPVKEKGVPKAAENKAAK